MKAPENQHQITSIGWLNDASPETVTLSICFKFSPVRFLQISKETFNSIKDDAEKLLATAIENRANFSATH